MSRYFKVPNAVIDELCRILKPVEYICLTIVIRKTMGWHKKHDAIALSQFQKLGGFKSRKTIIAALTWLSHPDVGLITATRKRGKTTVYALGEVFEDLIHNQGILYTGQAEKMTQVPRSKNTQVPPANLCPIDTNKRQLNKIKEREKRAKSAQVKVNEEKPAQGGQVKGALARDSQGLIVAGAEIGLEPGDDELAEDFKGRMWQELKRRSGREMQG